MQNITNSSNDNIWFKYYTSPTNIENSADEINVKIEFSSLEAFFLAR